MLLVMMVAVGKCHFYHTDDKKARKVSVLYVSWVDVRKDFSLWTPCRDAAPFHHPHPPVERRPARTLAPHGGARSYKTLPTCSALCGFSQQVPV